MFSNTSKKFIIKKKWLKGLDDILNYRMNSTLPSWLNISDIDCINAFTNQNSRSNNDAFNKVRETIIVESINNKINPKWMDDTRWKDLKSSLNSYIGSICSNHNINYDNTTNIQCSLRAGRKYNHDFSIIINSSREFNVEFKFNADDISDTPQFVSPMKPSQYLSNSFEEFSWKNILEPISTKFSLSLPELDTYKKEVNSPSPDCLKLYQEKYYKGCSKSSKYSGEDKDIAFYNFCKNLNKVKLEEFINNTELDIIKLSDYLIESQQDKHYMLYKNGSITYQTNNSEDYKIVSYNKDAKRHRYIGTTQTGKKIKILLRWKNGNGIAYPAFQIS